MVYIHIQSWIGSFQTATSGISSLARLPWGSSVSSEIAEVVKNRDTPQAIQIYEFGKYLLHFAELCLSLKGFLRTTVWTIDVFQGYVCLPNSLNLLSVIVYTFTNERWPAYIVLGLACLIYISIFWGYSMWVFCTISILSLQASIFWGYWSQSFCIVWITSRMNALINVMLW